ncbi:MAG TPA: DNA-directed RNA polymerase subunit beta [Candidatus Pacearchaeota archaeon]|nr:DNA-directed RNA polymerase subunit beta [Candidatus Pacearchaeota archaeon]
MQKKNFGHYSFRFPCPDLVQFQIDSYEDFLENRLKNLFDEFSPIKDYGGGKEFELYFDGVNLQAPKITPKEAKEKNVSYESPLLVEARLKNKSLGEEKKGEVYLCNFPLITENGTFILNGVERVLVSQLIRSPGVFFTATSFYGKNLFGAKVIPNRGAWLEFETDQNGVIWVKIDRKRRVPATTLLRAFGLESTEEIKKIFEENIKGSEINYIEETLKRDLAKNQTEAIMEIYSHLRPGDLVTIENAKSFFDGMFFNHQRYDLSEVGRWRIQQRMRLEDLKTITKNDCLLNINDLVLFIKEIIELNKNPKARPDNIDHLGNRRIRTLAELLESRLRVGMLRMERIIKDRMSTVEISEAEPKNIINPHPFAAQVKEFFTLSQLSQFMDNENPLAELEHKRRLSAMGPGGLTRERAGFEVRDVQPSHYGRICPIQTPEGQNVGLITHLALFSRINRLGFLETPYFKVENGKVTNKVEYLNAYVEEKYNIAPATTPRDSSGKILPKKIEARIGGEPGTIEAKKIDYIDVSPQQILSGAASLIPFLEHDDANRALMGCNMQKQSVPCLRPEPPLVSTGMEDVVAQNSSQVIFADEDGEVKEVDGSHILIENKKDELKEYPILNFVRSNQYTSISQRPIVKKGQRVKKGDILAEGVAIADGHLALGKNLLCAFVPWRGANYEDAIILSERVAKKDIFTSVHIEDFSCDVRETKLGPEVTTSDIPNVSETKLRNLDKDGIIRIGAEVQAGDILVGKVSPKGEEELTSEEMLLKKIFGEEAKEVKDTSLVLPHGKRGKVIRVSIFDRAKGDKLEPGVIKKIQVEVAYLRKITVGDKLAGRHGNKGVIAKILPEEEMPFLEDGTPVDIILNPLSVASRMNIGQILETHLGFAAKKLGYQAITPAFDGASEADIKNELKNAGLPEDGKIKLFDGRTGLPFQEKVAVGYMYIMKLIHMAEDKIHMRSIGPYSLITQQPLGGKAQFGGQRFGEMEVWALEGYGAAYTLQEMLTVKSDDVAGRAATYEAIVKGEEIKTPNIPSSFNVLVAELKSLGLNIELIKKQNEK